MATTIKVDSTLATFTWQDDQALDPASDVDYFVKGTDDYVPLSQKGKAPMHPAHSLDSLALTNCKHD